MDIFISLSSLLVTNMQFFSARELNFINVLAMNATLFIIFICDVPSYLQFHR